MRAQRLNSMTAIAYLALSTAIVALPQVAVGQVVASLQPTMPAPDVADVPPPTAADVPPAPQAAPAPSETPAAAPAPVAPPAAASTPPTPSPAPAQTATAAPGEQAIIDRLRDSFAAKADRLFHSKTDRAAADEFYKARNYAPIWLTQAAPNGAMKAAIARLKAADADGLEAQEYPTPDLAALGSDPDALALAELRMTASVLEYARHAQAGRTTPSRLSPNIDVAPPVPEPAAILKTVSEAQDQTAALDSFNPPHEGFRLLKAKLVELRGSPDDQIVQIPAGPAVKKGKKDARVPLLRQRLHIEGDPSNTIYDEQLADAVKAFQRERGMQANGVLTPATVDALNGKSKSKQINAVVSNMERWRWLPRNLGSTYVMVNIPDFTLKMMHNGERKFTTRIVVGKPNTPSPIFSDEIENIVVNPSWHVPQSIIYGEYMPALERDPGALARMGLQVSYARDGSISIKQPPGERNALGRLKFNFPNKFQVYLHDTPTKHLFAQERRAFSHGCMRVQNPELFGEALLSVAMPSQNYTAGRLKGMYGKAEATLKFPTHVPVHLVYMNAYVDDAGKLVVRDDIYGYDNRTWSALNGKYIQVAERSQKVTPGVPNPARRAHQQRRQVADQGPPRRDQGFFLFPFFR